MKRAYCPPKVCSGMSQQGATTLSCRPAAKAGQVRIGGQGEAQTSRLGAQKRCLARSWRPAVML